MTVLQLLPAGFPTWKYVVVGILYLDIASGAVANLSTSTNQYYRGKTRLRIGFLLLHSLHPALFITVLPEAWPYYLFAGTFTLVSALVVNALGDAEFQQNLAALLVVTGIVVSLTFHLPQVVLFSFAPLFMIKLVLGFAVQRPEFH